MRIKNDVDIEQLKDYGFKYGSKEKLLYKTKENGLEAKIYIDLQPCHNKNNHLYIESLPHSIPNKITNKLYDLIQAGLVEKE